ncbi:putative galactarate transporter [Sporomusa carbonis]
MTWLPGYLVMGRGFSLIKTGWFAMVPYLVCIATIPLGGYISDLWTKTRGSNFGRRIPIVIGFAGCGIFLILGAYTPNAYVAVLYMALSIGALGFSYGAFWGAPITISPKDSGVIGGVLNTLGTLAGVFAPAITGFIVTASNNKFENALYFGASLAFVGIIFLLTIVKIKPILQNDTDVCTTNNNMSATLSK